MDESTGIPGYSYVRNTHLILGCPIDNDVEGYFSYTNINVYSFVLLYASQIIF